MTERANSEPADGRALARTSEQVIRSRIGRAVSRAKLAGLWESLWPRVLPILGVVALFLIVSWFGAWRVLPEWGRWAVVAAFGVALLVALVPPVRARMPDRAAALLRVERATGAPHRPATTFNDRLASDQDDPGTRALWVAHRERLLSGFGRLRVGAPSPGVPRRDPFAFRFLAVLLLAVGFLFAGGERGDRIAEAFRGPPEVVVAEAVANARIDAWANPPDYTDRPPIFLTGDAIRTNSAITVPAGTTVVVRVSGAGADKVGVFSATNFGEDEILPVEATATMPPSAARNNAARPQERQIQLEHEATITVRRGTETLNSWQFAVIADAPPAIMPNAEASRAGSGALQLAYHVIDDYGVVSAEARIERQEGEAEGARPLYTAPSFPLALPRLRVREGDGETIKDLTNHPWAGAHVKLTMVAKDELNQEGVSEPLLFVLPSRVFTNPISRALVEQRRDLAMDANRAPDVANVLDILTIEPDKFLPGKGAYLAIRSAYYRTLNARTDDDLRGVVDFLWEVAVGLEDGNLSNAANNLRDAQEALRQALQRGAPPEEIQKLMDQLRQAMDEYMQALAEQQQSQGGEQQQQSQNNPNQQEIGPDQLQQMMDQIQQLAENGSFEAAQEMLNQLQQMMENMQTAQQQMQQGGQQQQGQSPMGEALEQLGELIQRQQQLMDQTFSFNQNQNQPGMGPMTEQELEEFMRGMKEGEPGQQTLNRQTPMTEEEIQEALRQFREGRQQRGEELGDIQQGQQELQESLQALMDQLGQMGMEPSDALGQADQSMGNAQSQLRNGDPGRALNPQGNALDQLRAGAQAMAEEMAQQQGQQGQEGMRQSQAGGREDPLGRQMRNRGPDFGTRVKVPDEIDVQRAREILETIRRRLDDMSRPVIERNYLERLLDLY